AVFVVMANVYPPGGRGFTWSRWWEEDSAWSAKAMFLLRTYVRPGALAFCWIAGLQLQMRLRANPAVIFAIVYVSAAAVMSAWRSWAMGRGVLRAYALGIAMGQTMASRVYAVKRVERGVWGRRVRWYEIVWVGNGEAVERLRAEVGVRG